MFEKKITLLTEINQLELFAAVITKDHLICTQTDSQVIIVNFGKPKRQVFDKISKLEPKLLTIELSGPSGRRIEKKICVNKSGELVG